MADLGRPNEFTAEIIHKLEEAFAIDASVTEACFYAGISRQSYYNNVKEGTEIFDRLEALRETPILLARRTAVEKIKESYQNAMDYLSRKRKDEFSSKQEVKHSGALNIAKVLDEIENGPEVKK